MSESRFAILDPVAGISGDMVLGALLAAGAEEHGCGHFRRGSVSPRWQWRSTASVAEGSAVSRSTSDFPAVDSNPPPSRTPTRTTITTAITIPSTTATTVPTGMWVN